MKQYVVIRSWHILHEERHRYPTTTLCGRAAVGLVTSLRPPPGKSCEICLRLDEEREAKTEAAAEARFADEKIK